MTAKFYPVRVTRLDGSVYYFAFLGYRHTTHNEANPQGRVCDRIEYANNIADLVAEVRISIRNLLADPGALDTDFTVSFKDVYLEDLPVISFLSDPDLATSFKPEFTETLTQQEIAEFWQEFRRLWSVDPLGPIDSGNTSGGSEET